MRLTALISVICIMLAGLAVSAERVLVVNGPRAQKQAVPDGRTRVVNVRGKGARRYEPQAMGDVCGELKGRFYCKDIGKKAFDPELGADMGTVRGVAWKLRGEVIGSTAGDGSNAPVTRDGFYYIVDPGEGEPLILLESSRVAVR